ncbi:MAG: hypothetical protein M1837_004318 [Sclerophora amabilis]|nr:MAG: hypothetical protein M1837_004318 [Sclerophora amabilis]
MANALGKQTDELDVFLGVQSEAILPVLELRAGVILLLLKQLDRAADPGHGGGNRLRAGRLHLRGRGRGGWGGNSAVHLAGPGDDITKGFVFDAGLFHPAAQELLLLAKLDLDLVRGLGLLPSGRGGSRGRVGNASLSRRCTPPSSSLSARTISSTASARDSPVALSSTAALCSTALGSLALDTASALDRAASRAFCRSISWVSQLWNAGELSGTEGGQSDWEGLPAGTQYLATLSLLVGGSSISRNTNADAKLSFRFDKSIPVIFAMFPSFEQGERHHTNFGNQKRYRLMQ